MRVLVTGGAGYIGSHTARSLAEGHAGAEPHEVVALDDLSTGHAAALPDGLGVRLVRLDLGDALAVARFLGEERFDAVIHFAARCLVPESVVRPRDYWRSNVVSGLNLLDALIERGPRRIVFSSSCAVYGHPDEVPLREDHATRPVSPYGRTKLAFERALEDYAAAYGIGSVALRYFNAAGASQDGAFGEDHEPETHLIPRILAAALDGKPVAICGTDYPTPDGTCIRDYVHVDDLARAHALALERVREGAALAVNVGTGRGHSVREVIEAARRATGRPIAAVEEPRRPGDPAALVADVRAAKEALGFEARRDLDDTLRTAWAWHTAHPLGYGDRRR